MFFESLNSWVDGEDTGKHVDVIKSRRERVVDRQSFERVHNIMNMASCIDDEWHDGVHSFRNKPLCSILWIFRMKLFISGVQDFDEECLVPCPTSRRKYATYICVALKSNACIDGTLFPLSAKYITRAST